MKALVVDDEKLIVKGLKFSLEQDGYEVDCAYDGQEAIDKARDNARDTKNFSPPDKETTLRMEQE